MSVTGADKLYLERLNTEIPSDVSLNVPALLDSWLGYFAYPDSYVEKPVNL